MSFEDRYWRMRSTIRELPKTDIELGSWMVDAEGGMGGCC